MATCVNILTTIYILLLTFEFGASVKCFKCSSLIDPLCQDTFNDGFPKVNCAEDDVCLKLVVPSQELFNNFSTLVYIRNCIGKDYCNENKTVNRPLHHCSECSTDLCNSSFVIKSWTLSAVLSFIFVRVIL